MMNREYPGRLGSACNKFDDQNDAKNFLVLLQELRAALNAQPNGDKLEISLATRVLPFDGPNGLLTDVSEYGKVVNHINIMAYDINGSWSALMGADAPLTGADGLSHTGGAQAWIDAGFPAQQINMGVPLYGRSFTTREDMTQVQSLVAPFHESVPPGDNNYGLWTDPCEGTSAYSGVWKYNNPREQGLIDGIDQARAPWIRKFDQDSHTPWLFNPQTKQLISYDDPESLRRKSEYAKRKDFGGMMLWAINQDTDDFERSSGHSTATFSRGNKARAFQGRVKCHFFLLLSEEQHLHPQDLYSCCLHHHSEVCSGPTYSHWCGRDG